MTVKNLVHTIKNAAHNTGPQLHGEGFTGPQDRIAYSYTSCATSQGVITMICPLHRTNSTVNYTGHTQLSTTLDKHASINHTRLAHLSTSPDTLIYPLHRIHSSLHFTGYTHLSTTPDTLISPLHRIHSSLHYTGYTHLSTTPDTLIYPLHQIHSSLHFTGYTHLSTTPDTLISPLHQTH